MRAITVMAPWGRKMRLVLSKSHAASCHGIPVAVGNGDEAIGTLQQDEPGWQSGLFLKFPNIHIKKA